MINFFKNATNIRKNEITVYIFAIISIIYVLFLYTSDENEYLFRMLKKVYRSDYGLVFAIFMILGLAGFMGENAMIISKILMFLHATTYILVTRHHEKKKLKKLKVPKGHREYFSNMQLVPKAYRPNSELLGIGNDILPCKNTFSGIYTQSGIAYDFNMS